MTTVFQNSGWWRPSVWISATMHFQCNILYVLEIEVPKFPLNLVKIGQIDKYMAAVFRNPRWRAIPFYASTVSSRCKCPDLELKRQAHDKVPTAKGTEVIWCWRRSEVHQITSVLSALSWSRLDRIHLTTSLMQSDTRLWSREQSPGWQKP